MYKFFFLSFFLLLSCNKGTNFIEDYVGCQTYITVEGKHDFYPIETPSIRNKPTKLLFKFKYYDNFTYYYDNLEWRDWLKGGGISFNLISNFEDAIMWVFRYNYITNKIEHTAYLRINGNLVKGVLNESDYEQIKQPNNKSKHWWGTDEVLFELSHNQIGICEVNIDYTTKQYIFSFYTQDNINEKIVAKYPFFHNNTTTRDIGLYFGGTILPYSEMQIMKCTQIN